MKTKKLVMCALTAAAYAALTLALAPISYGPVQLRVSEALCVLPFIMPETALGLFLGCLTANLMTGNILDIVFGSLATLAAGLLTGLAGKKLGRDKLLPKLIGCLPPVVINGLVVGAVICFAYTSVPEPGLFALYALQIGAGEAAAVFGIGLPLLCWLMAREGREKGKFCP